ncbi:MAG: hypothetical protein KDG50_09100 [Chromatiales bacterium]|nr:hypothetical protein [Chromatiales bacterium]
MPHLLLAFTAWLVANPSPAANLYLSLGSGGDSYYSRGLDFDSPMGDLPLIFRAGVFQGVSGGDVSMQSLSAGLDWQINDVVSVGATASRIDDDVFRMDGLEASASLSLNPLWGSKLTTALNLDYGEMDYAPDTTRNLPASLLARLPRQSHYAIGLTQNLSESVYVYASYTDYDYTNDPAALAQAVATAFLSRRRLPPNPAYTVAAFPKDTLSTAVGWQADPRFALSASYSESKTAIGQDLRSAALGMTYYADTFHVGITLTNSRSSSIKTPGGLTLSPDSDDNYLDLSVGWYL